MRDRLTTAGELVGGAMIATGCSLWSVALGLVVGGAGLVAFSYLAAGVES